MDLGGADLGLVALGATQIASAGDGSNDLLTVTLHEGPQERTIQAAGNGPVAAFVAVLAQAGIDVQVLDYAEHALSEGESATAAAYVECEVDGEVLWGAGMDPSITTASLKAIISAVNRAKRSSPVGQG
ncbi:MAG TPA: alpha-isopropylmalate synthase regulatory domain-containing protein [Polyangiales bacterium]